METKQLAIATLIIGGFSLLIISLISLQYWRVPSSLAADSFFAASGWSFT
jgi:hypothetical protein